MTSCAFCEKRFTQTDPLEPDVGSAYSSAYTYGSNNPVRYTDPSGLRASVGGVTKSAQVGVVSPIVAPPLAEPVAGVGGGAMIFVTPGPGLPKDTLLSTDDWSPYAKKRPKGADRKLNGKRVLFRKSSGTAQSLTPRFPKDTDNYPINGLSTNTYPKDCFKCVILSVDILESFQSLQLRTDPKDATHVFIQGYDKEQHIEWAKNRDVSPESDERTRGVLAAVIGFFNSRILAN